jgi:hypothetical protein
VHRFAPPLCGDAEDGNVSNRRMPVARPRPICVGAQF